MFEARCWRAGPLHLLGHAESGALSQLPQAQGPNPWCTGADRPAVDAGDRDYAGHRAGDEDLIGLEEIVMGQAVLANGKPELGPA